MRRPPFPANRRGLAVAGLGLLMGLVLASLGCRREAPAELRLSVPWEVESLDPHRHDWVGTFSLVSHVYEPLVQVGVDSSPKPALATTWESPDPSTWIFTIRPGVRFHSGKALTAADVVYSLRRLLEGQGLEMSAYLVSVSSVRALDAARVQVATQRPVAAFLTKLRFVMIVPEGSEGSLDHRPDGTGPYRVDSFTRGEAVTMARNEEYWGTRPVLTRLTFRLERSPREARDDLLAGSSGFAECTSREIEQSLRGRPDLVVRKQSSGMVKFLSYDLDRDATPFCSARPNPFRNRNVRQAIQLAIDRPALVAQITAPAVPIGQVVPSTVFGHDPSIPDVPHDLARARRLLAEAGYPEGFRVTLHARRILLETATLVAGMLGRAGIRVDVVDLPDAEYFDFVAARRATFMLSRLGSSSGDAGEVLEDAFHSRDAARLYGASNDGRYADPEVDRLIEESGAVFDPAERGRRLRRVMTRVMEDLVWIPLYVDEDVFAFDRRYVWEPRPDGYLLASEITLRR